MGSTILRILTISAIDDLIQHKLIGFDKKWTDSFTDYALKLEPFFCLLLIR